MYFGQKTHQLTTAWCILAIGGCVTMIGVLVAICITSKSRAISIMIVLLIISTFIVEYLAYGWLWLNLDLSEKAVEDRYTSDLSFVYSSSEHTERNATERLDLIRNSLHCCDYGWSSRTSGDRRPVLPASCCREKDSHECGLSMLHVNIEGFHGLNCREALSDFLRMTDFFLRFAGLTGFGIQMFVFAIAVLACLNAPKDKPLPALGELYPMKAVENDYEWRFPCSKS